MEFDVIIEQDEDGVYVAHVPELPGCHTQGESISEVLENIKEAIVLYLEHTEEREIEPVKFIAVHKVRVSTS